MPDKPLTVVTYAASASLAAIALIYFFNPNFLLDGDDSSSTAASRKKGIVGLSNPGNDCFINSVLQSLAGLGDVRLYLIRELHRRRLDGADVYHHLPEKIVKPLSERMIRSLQAGEVTQGLKEMMDHLNERPIYKKTISAAPFVAVLEEALGTRISKSQQDAQELLQIVAERLCEEYHAGKAARKRTYQKHRSEDVRPRNEAAVPGAEKHARRQDERPTTSRHEKDPRPQAASYSFERNSTTKTPSLPSIKVNDGGDEAEPLEEVGEDEAGFPLEGFTESRIECQQCHFMPKAKPVSFVMLTLSVPQKSSATLNECFDALFKTEYIDDYVCDQCRLSHAIYMLSSAMERTQDSKRQEFIEKIEKVKQALETNPEEPPKDVELPTAPTQRIARHVEVTSFPRILVIHLSRSIYDTKSSSTKNAAKVSFPERLPLGGLLNRRHYKLLGLVCHKGTHDSGHYEAFRRQHLYPPYSTPLGPATGPYGKVSPSNANLEASLPQRPQSLGTTSVSATTVSPSTTSASIWRPSVSLAPTSTRPSSDSESVAPKSSSHPREAEEDSKNPSLLIGNRISLNAASIATRPAESTSRTSGAFDSSKLRRRKKPSDRWWRISDDRIKESSTKEVLGMQKEVYMLFYEIERE